MLRKGKKVISKLLFLAICTSFMTSTITFGEEKYSYSTQEVLTNVIQTTGAAVNVNQSDFEFDLNTGTITKYIGNETIVEIPSEINGAEVKSIGDGAFSSSNSLSNCNIIAKIIIPDTITSIGEKAFAGCSELSSITIPDSVTSIGRFAFFRCSSLRSVTIPNSITKIEEYTFSSCDSLESVTIPNSVISIGDYAFSNCGNLGSITIPDSVTSIGYDAFWAGEQLKEISVDNNNTSYKSIDGVLYSKDGTELIEYPIGKLDESYTILDGTKNIAHDAFCYSKLKKITIPDSVVSIGKNAFFGCNYLQSVIIPEGVTSIGDNAFAYCSNLKSVSIPKSVVSLGDNGMSYNAFDGCSDAIIFYVENEDIEQLLIKTGISISKIKIAATIPEVETSLTLNTTHLNLVRGNTDVLIAKVVSSNTTNAAVTWESSNTSVAVVSANGEVTAVGAGNATITCTVSDGSGKSATCNVAVSGPISNKKLLSDEISYAQGVVNKLNDAIADAKAVADNSNATEEDAKNAAEKLQQIDETLANTLQAGKLTIISCNIPAMTTTTGKVPVLPASTNVTLSDGTTTSAAITWEAAATEPTTYSYLGGVIIYGTLEEYDYEPVSAYVIVNQAVGQTETNSEIDLSICGTMRGSDIPAGKVKVFLKLNVDNQQDYNVVVRGETAIYDAMNKQFSVLVNSSGIDSNSLKLTASDIIVTKE